MYKLTDSFSPVSLIRPSINVVCETASQFSISSVLGILSLIRCRTEILIVGYMDGNVLPDLKNKKIYKILIEQSLLTRHVGYAGISICSLFIQCWLCNISLKKSSCFMGLTIWPHYFKHRTNTIAWFDKIPFARK